MADYIHHVPGRLRIRSKMFRQASSIRNQALRELRVLSGVTGVRLNEKAASVTISYDQSETEHDSIIELLEVHNCVDNGVATRPVVASPSVAVAKAKADKAEWNLSREVGRIALNALVSKGVSYSLSSILKV